jgi:Ni,Fe-hydrogenase III small subunit
VAARPDIFAWSAGPGSATLTRDGLVVPPAETPDSLADVSSELRARTRALRRSVHLRHVDTGSDGSEEWEILALLNPVYDIHRLGMFFTASPRHADILLATGPGAHGMAGPLRETYEAMPHPKVVIAVGTDAVGGGIISPSYATSGGIGGIVPVDVWLPGSPPPPFAILSALLLALGRLPSGDQR